MGKRSSVIFLIFRGFAGLHIVQFDLQRSSIHRIDSVNSPEGFNFCNCEVWLNKKTMGHHIWDLEKNESVKKAMHLDLPNVLDLNSVESILRCLFNS